jgi:hypothetical protein
VIAVVAGVIGSGWYTEQYQPTRTNKETATRILEDSGDLSEGTTTRIMEDAEYPNEVTVPTRYTE